MQRTNRGAPAHRAGGPASVTPPSVVMLRYTEERACVATGHRTAAVRRCQHRGGVDWLRRRRSWCCPGRAIDSFRPDFGRDGRPPATRDANCTRSRRDRQAQIELGRKPFPAKIARKRYWSDPCGDRQSASSRVCSVSRMPVSMNHFGTFSRPVTQPWAIEMPAGELTVQVPGRRGCRSFSAPVHREFAARGTPRSGPDV